MTPEDFHQLPFPFESEQSADRLREAVAPYLDLPHFRRLAADTGNVYEALRGDSAPDELQTVLRVLSILLRPSMREQVSAPADIAALLMVEMGYLMQEQLRVICLDTKNYIQKMQLVYQGSVNSAAIRPVEVFREAVRLNSSAIIVAHNHPGTDCTPSPEDVVVTRQIVAAGNILGIDTLDHIIVSQGKWTSLRERHLGFNDSLS